MIALADVYDALTSERCYKPAYSHDAAMKMILDGQCGAFQPLLLECLRDIGDTLEQELTVQNMLEAENTHKETSHITEQLHLRFLLDKTEEIYSNRWRTGIC